MYRMLLSIIFVFLFVQNVFCQNKKPMPKPAIRMMNTPVFNVKDDPSPVKYIQLKKDTPVYVPKNFYIQKVIDNTPNADSIGFILQPKSGKKQRISFVSGTANGIQDYFNFKIARDTTLYPVIFTVKNISLSEEKDKDYRNGIFRYAFTFEYINKDKPLVIGGADGRFSYTTHVTQNKHLDSNIAKALIYDIDEVEKNLEEAIDKNPVFCKGVNTTITYKTDNSSVNDTIFFDGQQDLMWDDFASTATGGDNFFSPAIGLLFTPEINYEKGRFQLKIKAGAYFIKSHSWVGKKIKTTPMLYHLQYRFKLAWLESVRLKKKIETAVFTCTGYENEIRNLILFSSKQLEHTFEEYSSQTLTGSNKKEQNRWQEFIDKQIIEYEKIK